MYSSFNFNIFIRAAVYLLSSCYSYTGYASVTQILNDNFYPNPAALTTIKQSRLLLGLISINPYLKYTGTSNKYEGTVESNASDLLPYLLTGYRLDDNWVIGINAIPTSYAHINWPENSFIAQQSTQTQELYYRFGIQTGYQYNPKLSLGTGFNIEDNTNYCINFEMTPVMGFK